MTWASKVPLRRTVDVLVTLCEPLTASPSMMKKEVQISSD
jgi:hypothetical protein